MMSNCRPCRNAFPPGTISRRPNGAGSSRSPRTDHVPVASTWARLLRTIAGFSVSTVTLSATAFRTRLGVGAAAGGTWGAKSPSPMKMSAS